MSRPFGCQTEEEWKAHFAEVHQRWRAIGEQTAALRAQQEEVMRAAFSGAGLSDTAAEAQVATYLQELNAGHFVSGLAQFVRDGQEAQAVLPVAVEDAPGLITALRTEWEQMFSRLRLRLPSPRGQILLAARKPSGLPVHSLGEAVLWPVTDIAPLHDPDETLRVSSLGLEGDEEKNPDPDTPPKRTEGVADRIAEKIRSHLHLQREIKTLNDFWTEESASLAAFLNARTPEAAAVTSDDASKPSPPRTWWRPGTWFHRSAQAGSAANPAGSPWRDPALAHVPIHPKTARQLREWRLQTETEAESLRTADAGWKQRVNKIGEELAARRTSEARHVALELDPESIGQHELETARNLRDNQAKSVLRGSSEACAWISSALPRLAGSLPES